MIFVLPWAVPALPLLHLDPLDAERRVGARSTTSSISLFGVEGPSWLNSRWLALGSAIYSHLWKWLPFWTVILLAGQDVDPAGDL